MGKRHEARVLAIKILYSLDIKKELATLTDLIFDEIITNLEEPSDEYTKTLAIGVSQNLTRIDEIIKNTAINWRIDRMSIIDRNIIRLGIYELIIEEPAAIVINESILLAKAFGADNSSSFINGILDKAKDKLK